MLLREGGHALLAGFRQMDVETWMVALAGVSALVACCLSIFLIGEHLTAYNKPSEQKWIIGCIFMVPLYALCSFLSLWWPKLDLASNLLRNCYEAYTLYSFSMYLIACLGGEVRTIEKMTGKSFGPPAGPLTPLLASRKVNEEACAEHNPKLLQEGGVVREGMQHPFPLSLFMDPWIPGPHFYLRVKFGIVQYMVLKCIAGIAQLLLDPYRLYGEGDFDWATGYPYVAIILNFSQMWAIYCLVMFYWATYQYLQPIRPLAKFLTIKAIIFVTWWQGVIVAVIFATGLVRPPAGGGGGTLFQNSLQDFLVAIEMSYAAVAYLYAFPATPYKQLGGGGGGVAPPPSASHVAVLSDMANVRAPLDPDEVMASENTGCLRFLAPKGGRNAVTSFTASIHDVLFSGGEHVMKDVRETVHIAVEPVEKGFSRVNEGVQDTLEFIHLRLPWAGLRRPRGGKAVKDDSCLPSDLGGGGAGGSGGLADDDAFAGRSDAGSISDSGLLEKGPRAASVSRRFGRDGGVKSSSLGNLEGYGIGSGSGRES